MGEVSVKVISKVADLSPDSLSLIQFTSFELLTTSELYGEMV